jgi:hypothetical protein
MAAPHERRWGRPAGAELHPTVDAVHTVREPRQTGAAGQVCAADAVVADLNDDQILVFDDGHAGSGRRGVACDVGQRLGDHEVGRRLHRRRRAVFEHDLDVDGDADTARERRQCGVQPPVGQDRGVDTTHKCTQFAERQLCLRVSVDDQVLGGGGVGVKLLARHAQIHCQ